MLIGKGVLSAIAYKWVVRQIVRRPKWRGIFVIRKAFYASRNCCSLSFVDGFVHDLGNNGGLESLMSKKPNFFIIGAPKCGTTSLAAWLAEHPNIYLSPIKEPFYFSHDIRHQWIHTWDQYLRLFESASSEHTAVGEASTSYLFSKVAVPTIEQRLPGARYIVMLRNPVDMAYALHEQQLRVFHENLSDFVQAWYLASKRRSGRQVPPGCPDPVLLDYPAWCRLGEQLKRLYTVVPRERVLVLVLDDVKKNPRREYLRVLDFLGVPDDGRQVFPVHNPAREWRWSWFGKALRGLSRGVAWAKHVKGVLPRRNLGVIRKLEAIGTRRRPRRPLPAEFRAELERYFAEDIQLLEELLGRDLSFWRRGCVAAR